MEAGMIRFLRDLARRLRILVRDALGIVPRPLDRDNDGHNGGSRPR
jgi:hypothetical protein